MPSGTAGSKLRKRLLECDAVSGLYRVAFFILLWGALSIHVVDAAFAETRTLKLFNTHTKERVEVTFKRNGRYIPSGLREANRFLRDWRRNEITNIDPKLLDLVWEVYQKVGAKQPIYVVSSYRSPATNNMLRKRSRGVAKTSQHTLGKAMDFYIPGVSLAKLRAAGLRKHVGGVGYYPKSGSPFVHMDTGRVRHWPRMTRSQLAKVFPNGKTLHVPTDGKPLKGYKVALAEAKSGKSRTSAPAVVASSRPSRTNEQSLTNAGGIVRPASTGQSGAGGNVLASLFGSGSAKEEQERARVASVRPDRVPIPPADLTNERSIPKAKATSVPEDTPETTVAPPLTAETDGTADPEQGAPDDQDRIILAGIVPSTKPAYEQTEIQVAAIDPNTLDAQQAALENGQQPVNSPGNRFDTAALPTLKPTDALLQATQLAARNSVEANTAIPVPAPEQQTNDPVAAILAATGGTVPQPSPASQTLAYASAAGTSSLRQREPIGQQIREGDAENRPFAESAHVSSVSGRIPKDEILDPLAGFAGLPDKSEPRLISGNGTTRNKMFASFIHPDHRSLANVLTPGNRFLARGFELFPYGALRTDRFEGPAIVVLPVTFAR